MTQNCDRNNIDTFDKKYLEEKLSVNRSNLNIFLKAIGMSQSTFTTEEVARILELRELKERENLTIKQMTERFGNVQAQNNQANHKQPNQPTQPQNQPQDDRQALINADRNIGRITNKVVGGIVFKNVNDAITHVPKMSVQTINILCDGYNGDIRMEEAADRLIEELMSLPNSSQTKQIEASPYDMGASLSDVGRYLTDGTDQTEEEDEEEDEYEYEEEEDDED